MRIVRLRENAQSYSFLHSVINAAIKAGKSAVCVKSGIRSLLGEADA